MKRYTVPAAAMLLALVLSACSEPAETTSSAAAESQAISSAVEALPEESSSAPEEVEEETESEPEESKKETAAESTNGGKDEVSENIAIRNGPIVPAPAPAPAEPAPAPAPAPAEQAPQNPEYVMPEEFDRLPTFEEMEPGQQGDNPMWGQPGNTDGIYGEHDDTIIFAQNGNQ